MVIELRDKAQEHLGHVIDSALSILPNILTLHDEDARNALEYADIKCL